MRRFLTAAVVCLPLSGFAAGDDGFAPPTPTETTTTCSGSKIWDAKTRSCVDSRESGLSDADRYRAVRELAYAGETRRAQEVLEAFEDPNTSAAQTYAGFLARQAGDMGAAMEHYARALARDPSNILARSYLGQAYVIQGDLGAARAELARIRALGGRQTWAEFALATAIRSGQGYAY